jgi:hypothetical protein
VHDTTVAGCIYPPCGYRGRFVLYLKNDTIVAYTSIAKCNRIQYPVSKNKQTGYGILVNMKREHKET